MVAKSKPTHKGGLELGEMVLILLLWVGIIAASMYLGNLRLESLPEDDRGIIDILNGGLEEIHQSFLHEVVSGDYETTTFRWMIGHREDAPDAVPLGDEGRLTAEMLFNGTYINNVRGIAMSVYEPTAIDTQTRVKCYGVFLGESTPMDQWMEDGAEFTFEYFPYPVTRRVMEGCHVTYSGVYRTANDSVFRTYFFDCPVIWEGSRPSTIETTRTD